MKNLVTFLCATVLAVAGSSTLAQTANTAPPDTSNATKPTGKEAMDAQMNLQKNKPSKTPTEAEKKTAKSRPGGQAGMQSQMDMQKNKPSKPVDPNAKAPPRPDASKMTPEERAAFRKDVVKESKP